MAAPLLAQAMDDGTSAGRTVALADWIARIGMVCLLAPPPGDLLEALDALLLPVSTRPAPTHRHAKQRRR